MSLDSGSDTSPLQDDGDDTSPLLAIEHGVMRSQKKRNRPDQPSYLEPSGQRRKGEPCRTHDRDSLDTNAGLRETILQAHLGELVDSPVAMDEPRLAFDVSPANREVPPHRTLLSKGKGKARQEEQQTSPTDIHGHSSGYTAPSVSHDNVVVVSPRPSMRGTTPTSRRTSNDQLRIRCGDFAISEPTYPSAMAEEVDDYSMNFIVTTPSAEMKVITTYSNRSTTPRSPNQMKEFMELSFNGASALAAMHTQSPTSIQGPQSLQFPNTPQSLQSGSPLLISQESQSTRSMVNTTPETGANRASSSPASVFTDVLKCPVLGCDRRFRTEGEKK